MYAALRIGSLELPRRNPFGMGPSQPCGKRTRMIPLGRLGEAEDIAAAIAFLVGPDSHWINGQVIRANGGAI